MKINRLLEILNILDISPIKICESVNIDESDIYKLLSTKGNYDENVIRKVSDFLCIPAELLILPSSDQQVDNDLLLLPVFTSFKKPLYIFKLFALADIINRPLEDFLSFIPDDFSCTFSMMEKTVVFTDMKVKECLKINDEISIESSILNNYTINLNKGSIMAITIEMNY